MKARFVLALLSACLLWACGKPSAVSPGDDSGAVRKTEGVQKLEQLWSETTPFAMDALRASIFDDIQKWADGCTSKAFSLLLSSDASKYSLTVKYDNILSCYDAAFDKVLQGLKESRPMEGETYIWLLYNMGYVVKTPSTAFAIDVYHARARELEPYLDFAASTHVHQDHKSEPLFQAMFNAGKPVITNYYEPQNDYAWHSLAEKDYTVGNCAIHTFITRHNNGSTNVPVTVFQIDCGDDTGNFKLLHSGDSNFILSEYRVTSDVDVYIPRYAQSPLEENNVIGKAFVPDYVLLSHILELGHADAASSRWPLDMALERAGALDCDNTIVPFWGECLRWKNNELTILK